VAENDRDPTLAIADLRTRIRARHGELRAVDGVSFTIGRGEAFGLAGESGSGKSMTALSILRLLPYHAKVVGGTVRLRGEDLLSLPIEAMRALRGNRIAMIFQDPMTSLNPVFTVGNQITEALKAHRHLTNEAARAEAIRLMAAAEIPSAASRYNAYPHEFSGGMRQRVMLAMALACAPDLLIADEPTTALDVTVERQVLTLLQTLRREAGSAILLITHNLALIAEHCERAAVMYAGQIVELCDTARLFDSPMHPYTRALLGSMPRQHISQARIEPLSGLPPAITGERKGCSFAPRCPARMLRCTQAEPILREIEPGRQVRCHLYEAAPA
jgi:oligopeptide/dipeptide ABC transporter ATP-binding protein